MHYYPFNIGDYARRTQRLSLMEDLAYRRLLDLYYLDEQPFNDRSAEDLAREIGMRDYQESVLYVLRKFFVDGINKGADDVISDYRKNKKQKSDAGKASAKARKLKASEHVFNDRSTDEQLTNNQEPITKNHKPNKKTTPKLDRFDEFWTSYDKKVDLKKCKAKWVRLNKSEIDKIFSVLTDYVKSKPDRQFRKNPLTWLNGEGWNDEIEFKLNSVAPTPQPKTKKQVQEERDKIWQDRGFKSEDDMNKFDFKEQMKRYKK